jgi:hypothetical protein
MNKNDPQRPPEQQQESGALVPTEDTSRPGDTPNRIDVTGKVPENIRVDPDITEGHPGYEESGDSEIIPMKRLVEGVTDADEEAVRPTEEQKRT